MLSSRKFENNQQSIFSTLQKGMGEFLQPSVLFVPVQEDTRQVAELLITSIPALCHISIASRFL